MSSTDDLTQELENGETETGDKLPEDIGEHTTQNVELEAQGQEMAQSVPHEQQTRTSGRLRTQTEKGVQYEIELYERRFKSALSAWRRSVNESTIVMSDASDAKLLREARDKTIVCENELSGVFHHLCSLPLDVAQTLNYTEQYEVCESKHNEFLWHISQRVTDIQTEVQSRGSVRSSRSGKSDRSRASNTSKRSETAAKAAALATKLKYIDAEAKTRAELEKITTKCKLEMEQAKLGILEEEETAGSGYFGMSLPVQDQMTATKAFVEEHAGHFSQTPIVRPKEFPKLSLADQNEAYGKPPINSLPQDKWNQGVDSSLNAKPSLGLSGIRITSFLDPNAKTFESYLAQPQSENADNRTVDPTGAKTEVSPIKVSPNPVQSQILQGSETRNMVSEEILKLTKTLAEQVVLSRLPPPEPTVFDGDPLKFPGWKGAFHTLIEQKQIPASEKIHYLRKYLSNSVREVVENFFLLSSEDAFEEAKKLLEQRYGDPFVISNAFRNKLDRWPKIMARDGEGLRKFADFLNQCHAAMDSMKCLNILDDERENRKLLLKLPEWIVNRWNRQVSICRENEKRFPSFNEFKQFVTKEAKIACDPVTSLQALRSDQGNADKTDKFLKMDRRPVKGRSFKTEVEDTGSSVSFASNVENTGSVECRLCMKKNHELETCRIFLRKPLEERKAFIRERKLCYGCLGFGHVSKRCKTRKRCGTCNKFHPTCLHGDEKPSEGKRQKEESKEGTQGQVVNSHSHSLKSDASTNHRSCSLSAMILPVYVSHENDPSFERLVYALLDSQSDTSFILEQTCNSLGVKGVDTKLSLSTMYAKNKIVDSQRVSGLSVRGFNQSLKLPLPVTYTRQIMPANRSHIPTPETARQIPYLESIEGELMPLQDCEVGLLIGYNCARALLPRDVIASDKNGPFAQKTDLGWGIVGNVDNCEDPVELDSVGTSHRLMVYEDHSLGTDENGTKTDHVFVSFKTKVKEVINPDEINRMMALDFIEPRSSQTAISVEDRRFLKTVEANIKKVEGKYEIALPLKNVELRLPNNKVMARHRLESLKRRLERDEKYRDHYFSFMQEMINKGHAERVPENSLSRDDGRIWYIPHHGVYHPKKPNKIRVVFDCSAMYQGESLNKNLLQGPDLTNTLVGVLCRFRKERIAIMCDVEQMFLQFRVCQEQRDFLRFLWWENNDINKEPSEYRMCVHLFGAASSPGCANFGLKRIAADNEDEFGSDAAEFLQKDFYVDDGLTCLPDEDKAISLIRRSKEMCSKGGLKLHKFVSNSKTVIESIPSEERAKGLGNVDLLGESLPVERALGVQWCVESDCFQFRITLRDHPLTRRGILATVCSVYDPLGLISPVVLVGKQILQVLCADHLSWDDPLPESLRSKWERWRSGIHKLGSLEIKRCFKPDGFGTVVKTELHHFSDASHSGYGQCSYLRLMDDKGQCHCSLVMSKARVVPLKPITIPRLELSAAVVSVKISSTLQQELNFSDAEEVYWTDSKIVLGYIANDSRRFHVFVANRLQLIHDHTVQSQWRHVDTKENPADIASRGVSADELLRSSEWFNGPEFLWKSELPTLDEQKPEVSLEDCELKKTQVFSTQVEEKDKVGFCEDFRSISSWTRLSRVVALCHRFVRNVKQCIVERNGSRQDVSIKGGSPVSLTPTVEEMTKAKQSVIKSVQSKAFPKEIKLLQGIGVSEEKSDRNIAKQRKSLLKGQSSISRLDPFVDSVGLLRVGGRLSRANLDISVKHPIILPKSGHVTDLIVRHLHERVKHQGRGITSNAIRENGFWIIGLSSVVSRLISRCVTCRRLRGSSQVQKMADLPEDRIEPAPPFSYSGVDYFGPFYIREGRKELKRYGAIFTCLNCRAVHIETAVSLTTDAFINALRRFISIRGPIRELRSDRGTNFIGAERELAEAVSEMNEDQIKQFLLQEGCDYVTFKTNVPSASHMGGVWERQIRSVRNVLVALMHDHGTQLCDEGLRTLMCEAAAIVNSRPLSVQNMNDPMSPEPLTPNHLLTMKSKLILPPPGQFQRSDLYCRKRWRRVQYLANVFWSRWRKEYLQNLQVRNIWQGEKRNAQEGDIVLITDENAPRCQWRLGKIVEAIPDKDGLVRKVKILIGTSSLDCKGRRTESQMYLERPIHKLVLICEFDLVP